MNPAPSEAAPLPTRRRFGAFVLDTAVARLLRDGQPVELAPRPFALLVLLSSRPDTLLTKDEVLDAVWGHRYVGESALKVAINALRAALGDDAKTPRYVETVPRRGYRFIAAISDDGPAPAPQPPAAAAAPAPEPPPAGNLPPPGAPLIGRDDMLAALRDQLERHRLVTLLGPGGVGKTRLALAAAAHRPPADGVWLVRLDALADAEPLVATVARTLGLSAEAARSADRLQRALGPLQLRLVLDNAEHLADALAPLLAGWLAAAPGLTVLVTSQWPLQLADEQRLTLTPLGLPPDDATPDDIARHPAAALLIERVRVQQPGFAPDAAAMPALAAICRALDGLPLALELAAARVPLLGLDGVRAGLDERFRLLTRGRRDAPERQRTLQTALEWTWRLLGDEEQHTLQCLAVCAGSFSAELAAQVAGGGDEAARWRVLDAIDGLREKSLLVPVIEAAGGPAAAALPPRFRLFDSVRAFAAARLAERGDAPAVRDRHAAAVTALFAAADDAYYALPLMEWLKPLRPELDNLRAALGHAATASPALAVALFADSAMFWIRCGYKTEALRWYETLRPHADTQDDALRCRFELATAVLGAMGQMIAPDRARAALDRALPALLTGGEARRACYALYLQSHLMLRLEPKADRRPLLARMRALEQPDWSARDRRFATWVEAFILRDAGDGPGYRTACTALRALGRASGDRAEDWVATQALAQGLYAEGRADEAIDLLDQAVAEARAAGSLREQSTLVAMTATMRLTRDGMPATLALARDAVQLLRSDGMLWWMADALAWLPSWQGRWDDAARLQGWADGLVRRRGEQRGPVFAAVRAGFAQRLQQRPDAAALQALVDAGTALEEPAVLALCFGD